MKGPEMGKGPMLGPMDMKGMPMMKGPPGPPGPGGPPMMGPGKRLPDFEWYASGSLRRTVCGQRKFLSDVHDSWSCWSSF